MSSYDFTNELEIIKAEIAEQHSTKRKLLRELDFSSSTIPFAKQLSASYVGTLSKIKSKPIRKQRNVDSSTSSWRHSII